MIKHTVDDSIWKDAHKSKTGCLVLEDDVTVGYVPARMSAKSFNTALEQHHERMLRQAAPAAAKPVVDEKEVATHTKAEVKATTDKARRRAKVQTQAQPAEKANKRRRDKKRLQAKKDKRQ